MTTEPKVLADHDKDFAERYGIPMNDNRYYREDVGITSVDEQRWQAAQAVERYTWFELCRGFDDDRSREHFERFAGYENVPRNCGAVLEVGCGPFTQARTILQGRNLSSLTLLDPLLAEYMDLDHCSYKDGHLYGCPVSLLSIPAEKLPVSLKFDTIICINVLEHVRDAEAVLTRMTAALRDGGTMVLGEPCHDEYHPSREFNLAHPIMLKSAFLERCTRSLTRLYLNESGDFYYLIGQKRQGEGDTTCIRP